MTNPHHPQFDCDLHARHEQNETERLRRRVAELEQQRDELVKAAENLVRVKGRHHTEQAYKQLEAAIAKVQK